MACELYCCLLPRCEALRICRTGFPIATHSQPNEKICLRFRQSTKVVCSLVDFSMQQAFWWLLRYGSFISNVQFYAAEHNGLSRACFLSKSWWKRNKVLQMEWTERCTKDLVALFTILARSKKCQLHSDDFHCVIF